MPKKKQEKFEKKTSKKESSQQDFKYILRHNN